MRRRWLVGIVTTAAVAASSLGAGEVLRAEPSPRLDLDVAPEVGPNGLEVGVEGNAGALGVSTGASVGADGSVRIEDPPMYDSLGTDGKVREELYGPPVARAALGTGGLTTGFRGDGVLTNLSWPGPGLYEHVNFRTASRDWPNQGAPENAGSFGGLLLPDGTGTWFTEGDGWSVDHQAYEGASSGVLRTVLTKAGMTVTVRDVVHPTLDVLARRYTVEGAPSGARLAYFANMNPTTTRVPRVPSITDGILDDVLDVATAFDPDRGAMLHFRPITVDPAAATVAVTGRLGLEELLGAVASTVGDGVYVAVAGGDRPVDHQAGIDALGLVRDEAEGTPLLDPFYDARDGDLSGSDLAVGKTAGAQAWSATDGTVYLAAAGSPAAVGAAVDEARDLGFEGIREAAEADWAAWVDRARLPAVDDPQVRAVAQRALMLIRTAQDRRTGAIVANTTTQTPYRQDWLRDGAFFNYALLVAGYPEMVQRHNDFYRRAQSATGVWDPILCTDGAHCSAVFPFEIDAQAFGVWSLVMEHDLTGDVDRLRQGWDAIRRGTEVVYACHDPLTDLQCYAAEDDALAPTQGSQGAATVYLALRSAARAARVLGHDALSARWDDRADAIQRAARERLCRPECAGGRGANYLVWPSKLLVEPSPDAALAPLLARQARQVTDNVSFRTPAAGAHFQYPMERLFALATAGPDTAEHRALLAEAIRWLAHDVAEPGVHHFGERIFHLGDGRYLHSVGFPHVWSGAETYLAAALVHGVQGCPAGARVGDVDCRG